MDKVDIIINYYNPSGLESLVYQTLFCVFCYQKKNDNTVILVDGSGIKDEQINQLSIKSGFTYLWSDKKLTFAQGYNYGINYSIEETENQFVLLSANDIFVNADTVEKLLANVKRDTGCIIPYISQSDLYLQKELFNWKTRFPTGMTLNVNLFKKRDLIDIGKVPEELSGYFNDVVMSYRIIKHLKKKILLVNAGTIIHLGRATTSTNSSASYLKDLSIFREKYPNLALSNDYSPVDKSKLAQTFFTQSLFKLASWLNAVLFFKLITILEKFLLGIQYMVIRVFK